MFEGKTAIVTGGASGIGRATCELLARQGAKVVIADINQDGSEDVARSISESGGQAVAIRTDVTQPAEIETMVDRAMETFGGVHILCNVAADLSLLAYDDHLLNTDIEIWDKTYRADQLSVMVATKCVLPTMLNQGGGTIVNVSSVDGLAGDDTRFGYAMAKSAVNMLTKMVATRYGKSGIRCNAVAPGLVLSPMAQANMTDEIRSVFDRNSLVPGYAAEPREIASVMAFLASDDASFINGEVVRVDGGLLSHVSHLSEMRQLSGGVKPEAR